jgi:hypothetical protein
MWGGLSYVSDVSHQLLPRSTAATAAVAHDVGVVTETSGGYPLRRSSLNAERARCRGHPPTSPLTSSLSFPSPTWSCRPPAVPPPMVTRSRSGAMKRLRSQRWRLLHLGSVVSQKGAATREPWRPLRRWPPPLLPLPSLPGQLGLLAIRASQRSGGPTVRRGARGSLLPRRLLLLRRPAIVDGRRAARTRRPPPPSGPPPPLLRGPEWRLHLQWGHHGPG